jgi:Ca-activated chloride channel family protein
MTQRAGIKMLSRRASLGVFFAIALCLAAPKLFAQSGRNKQPTTTKSSTSSSGGSTRPKRVSTNSDSQNQSSQQTTTTPARVPSGTVILSEAPPPAPTPKQTPVPVVNTSAGEEVGAEDVVRISSNLVTVPASVVDAQGRAVIDLKLEDFELRVDGQPKQISDLNRSEVPVNLALLFDNSESLQTAREFEKQAAVRFFRNVMRPIDRAAVYSVATDVELAQPLTNNVQALVRTVEHFGKPEGATKLLDAIAEAANYLRPYPGRKVIVIVSDGEDTLSDLSFDDTLKRVLSADCQVYVVQTKQIEYVSLTGSIGNSNVQALAAERRMQDLTAHTGGAVYTPLQTSDLDNAFAQISADLSQQYVLSYYPSDDRADGRFRIISVRVTTRPNMRVRARRGYYPHHPGDKFSSNMQPYPATSSPAANSTQMDAAYKSNSAQSNLAQTDSLPVVAANAVTPKTSESAPVKSRRRGPAESVDEPDESISSNNNSGGTKTVVIEEPIIRRDRAPVKTSEPTSPPPKAAPTPPNSQPPATNSAPTISASTQPTATTKSVSGGVLNGRAVNLPKPVYPTGAKNAHVEGIVTVEVLLDEEGKVISARAIDGSSFLRQAAVDAARQARFSPTVLSGQPVKVSGVITYKFSLNN